MPSGYRDVKVNPVVNDHLCEIQLHLRRFYNLKSDQHAVYEWARELKVTKEMTGSHLFENLSAETMEEMIRLARSDWNGTGSCLTDLLSEAGLFVLAEEALRKVTRSA